jgi:hypothetical protein
MEVEDEEVHHGWSGREPLAGADAAYEFHSRGARNAFFSHLFHPIACFFYDLSICFGPTMFLSNFVSIDSGFPKFFCRSIPAAE